MVDALGVSAKEIYSSKNYMYIAFYAVLTLGSAAELIFGNSADDSAIYYIAACLVAIGVIGILYYVISGEKVLRTADGVTLKSQSHFYAIGSARTLLEALRNGDSAALRKMQVVDESGVRLDFLYAPDNSYGVAQVYAYEPYQYYAYEDAVRLSEGSLKELLK